MKKFFGITLATFAIFFVAGKVYAAVTRVQSCTAFSVSSVSQIFCTLPNVTAGDMITVGVWSGNLITNPTDGGDVFATSTTNTVHTVVDQFYALNVGGGTKTINVSSSFGAMYLTAIEWSGVKTSGAFDTSSTNDNGFDNSACSNCAMTSNKTPTTTNPNELLWGFCADTTTGSNDTFVPGTGYTTGTSTGITFDEYQTVSTVGQYAATGTYTATDANELACSISTFQALGTPTNVSGYAWGNKMGWVNFGTLTGGLEVFTTTVTGYAWSQNFGWINMAPASSGVLNDGNGNLSGDAWSQGTGYINFQGVTIDQNGVFHGVASGTVAGSLVFESSTTGCTDCNVTSSWKAPGTTPLSVSAVNIDGTNPATITLTPNTTTNVNVEATISDNTCAQITGGTTTILFYRSGVTSSSCLTASGNGVSTNLNCYKASAFTASSTCASGSQNTTTTFPVQYFAQATDASSSFPSQNWIATVLFNDSTHATTSADSAHSTSSNIISSLIALNVTTSSISYGTRAPSSTTGAVNQTTTVQNSGNSSTTLQLLGTALINGSKNITTSSQHYATSSFTFGGGEQSLSGTATAVSGFLLTSPTSTVNVQSTIFWGLTVPNGSASGTYTGTNTFTAVFSS